MPGFHEVAVEREPVHPAYLNPEVSHLGEEVLEQLSVRHRQLRGQHHSHVGTMGRSHHVREHEHSCVTQQDWGVCGHQWVQPVTHLEDRAEAIHHTVCTIQYVC